MLSDAITQMDFAILDWIAGHLRTDFLNQLLPLVSFLGKGGWLFIAIAVLFLLIPKTREWGAKLAVSLLLGLLFGNLIIKNAVMRVRPYDAVGIMPYLADKLKDYSFPSGHTMAAFEFCTVICCMPCKKVFKVIAVLLAFLMGFSRLYLYVHYPTDVLGGALLGILFGVMGVRMVEVYKKEKLLKS